MGIPVSNPSIYWPPISVPKSRESDFHSCSLSWEWIMIGGNNNENGVTKLGIRGLLINMHDTAAIAMQQFHFTLHCTVHQQSYQKCIVQVIMLCKCLGQREEMKSEFGLAQPATSELVRLAKYPTQFQLNISFPTKSQGQGLTVEICCERNNKLLS